MKKSKLYTVTAIFLAIFLIGAVFIGVGAGTIAKDKKYTETAENVVALVSSFKQEDGSRKYILYYNAEGQTFEPEYDYNEEKGDYIGKGIKVYFTKGSPDKIFIATDEKYYVFTFAGIAAILVSTIALGAVWVPIEIRKYIIKNGKTELVRIEKIVDVIGGKKIICDSKKIRGRNALPYKSKTIKQKLPKEIINSAITVYYLPKHKSFYYIDTDTIKTEDSAK